MLHLRLGKDLEIHLAGTHPCLTLSLSFAHLDGAGSHAVSFPMERSTWQGSEGGLGPMASEELNPANSHVRELGSAPTPGRAWR